MRKKIKLLALVLARSLGLFSIARWLTAPALRILCYHGTWMAGGEFAGDALFMRPSTFGARMALLRQLGFAIVPLATGVDALTGKEGAPDSGVVITIDDGWYGTYRDMLPVVTQFSIPATLYCDTAHLEAQEPIAQVAAFYLYETAPDAAKTSERFDLVKQANDQSLPMCERLDACRELARSLGVDFDGLIASRAFSYMTPQELRAASAAGLDIQLHTHGHTMGDGSTETVGRELERNRATLSAILGKNPESFRHFCYPSGVVTDGARAAFSNHGVVSATTTNTGLAWPGSDIFLLPRLLDNGNLSAIEFEAELTGFMDLVRRPRAVLTGWSSSRSVSTSAARGARPPVLG
jgi:peptidoglycan/xylan/chitin deacetylase (PgdA/CDA1 family)